MIDVEFLLESGDEINVYGDSSEAFLHLANPKDEYHFFSARINKQEAIRIIAALSDIFGLEMRSMRPMSEIVANETP